MNAIISLCHFCELHGPQALFCTQPNHPQEVGATGVGGAQYNGVGGVQYNTMQLLLSRTQEDGGAQGVKSPTSEPATPTSTASLNHCEVRAAAEFIYILLVHNSDWTLCVYMFNCCVSKICLFQLSHK